MGHHRRRRRRRVGRALADDERADPAVDDPAIGHERVEIIDDDLDAHDCTWISTSRENIKEPIPSLPRIFPRVAPRWCSTRFRRVVLLEATAAAGSPPSPSSLFLLLLFFPCVVGRVRLARCPGARRCDCVRTFMRGRGLQRAQGRNKRTSARRPGPRRVRPSARAVASKSIKTSRLVKSPRTIASSIWRVRVSASVLRAAGDLREAAVGSILVVTQDLLWRDPPRFADGGGFSLFSAPPDRSLRVVVALAGCPASLQVLLDLPCWRRRRRKAESARGLRDAIVRHGAQRQAAVRGADAALVNHRGRREPDALASGKSGCPGSPAHAANLEPARRPRKSGKRLFLNSYE